MNSGMTRVPRRLMIIPMLALVPVCSLFGADKPPTPVATQDFTESVPGTVVKFDMVRIPGGKFMMSPTEKGGQPKEYEIKPFWIAQTECLWEQFDTYAFQLDV